MDLQAGKRVVSAAAWCLLAAFFALYAGPALGARDAFSCASRTTREKRLACVSRLPLPKDAPPRRLEWDFVRRPEEEGRPQLLYVAQEALNVVSREGSPWSRPRLIVRCLAGEGAVFVTLGVVPRSDDETGQVRADLAFDSRVYRGIAAHVNRGKGAAIFFPDAGRFLARLVEHETFAMRFDSVDGRSHAAMFDTSGLLDALAPLLEPCRHLGVDLFPLIDVLPESLVDVFPEEIFEQDDENVTEPKRIRMVPPDFPERARRSRVEGSVGLRGVIDKSGRVFVVEIVREEPPGWGFAEASIRAVKTWRYEPARKDGEPIAVYFTIESNFSLE